MIGSSGIKAIVSFGANILLVRLLHPEDFGRFAVVQANVGLVGAIVNFRISDLTLRASKAELDQERLGLYSGAQAAETALVGSGAFAVLWFIDMLDVGAGILLAGTLASSWLSFQLKLYERDFEYKRISWIETGAHFTGHALAVGGAFVGIGALVLYLRNAIRVSSMFAGLYWAGALKRVPVKWLGIDELKRVLKEIQGFWLDGVLERAFDRIVIIAVGEYAGSANTGYFYQARRLAMVPHQLLEPLTRRMAFNYFSRQIQKESAQTVLFRSGAVLSVLLIATSMVAIVFGNPVILWVFGAEWKPVFSVLHSLTGLLVGITLFDLAKVFLMAQDRLKELVLKGRLILFIPLMTSIVIINVLSGEPVIILALGVSASYIIATATLFGSEWKR